MPTFATPSPQPKAPEGWFVFKGKPSKSAVVAAVKGLKNPLGTWTEFVDPDTEEELGLLQQWHYHPYGGKLHPYGWHKGSTLFRRVLIHPLGFPV